MASSSFDAALARVLAHEGGYSHHPQDPGGPTMRGIIQRVYDADRAARGLPSRPVRQIETAELRAIYRRQYWDAVRADDLPPGLDYVVFDGAVNSGPGQSAKWLQRALGVAADGQVGAVTLAAAEACADLPELVEAICDRRLAMLKNLSTWPVFGIGWGRRVAEVRAAGRQWVREGAATTSAALRTAGAKAPVGSATPVPPAAAAAGLAAGGGLATALAEAAGQLAPLAGGSRPIALLFTLLTLLGVAVTLAGLVLLWRRERARAAQADALDLAILPVAGKGT
ncbi:glycoside hydrolase family 108 protein [Xanthobacteraceae bacterium A53D]